MNRKHLRFSIGNPALKLLFIKLKHIGDALLLTPALVAVRAEYPDAEIHVVVRAGTEGILSGCPVIDQIHTSAPPGGIRRISSIWADVKLAMRLRRQRFDVTIDLGEGTRGKILARVSNAPVIHTNSRPGGHPKDWISAGFTSFSTISSKQIHQAERDFHIVNDVLPVSTRPVPALCFDKSRTLKWHGAQPLVVFHPATRWNRKKWPIEKWIQLGKLFPAEFNIVVSCGPDPVERRDAQTIAHEIGPKATTTDGELSWAELAGAFYSAKLFVGVDTAAMHLAAACQCPTVAIFGPSRAWAWAPWKTKSRIIGPTEEQWAEAAQGDTETFLKTIIQTMSVRDVFSACEELLGTSSSQKLANSGINN